MLHINYLKIQYLKKSAKKPYKIATNASINFLHIGQECLRKDN